MRFLWLKGDFVVILVLLQTRYANEIYRYQAKRKKQGKGKSFAQWTKATQNEGKKTISANTKQNKTKHEPIATNKMTL